MTSEIVHNAYFCGVFGLSEKAIKLYKEKRQAAGLTVPESRYYMGTRHDPHLVEVVRELGRDASGEYAKLHITTIPTEYLNCYRISECDGYEEVICDPVRLIETRLIELAKMHGPKLNDLLDAECREFLLSLIQQLNRPELFE